MTPAQSTTAGRDGGGSESNRSYTLASRLWVRSTWTCLTSVTRRARAGRISCQAPRVRVPHTMVLRAAWRFCAGVQAPRADFMKDELTHGPGSERDGLGPEGWFGVCPGSARNVYGVSSAAPLTLPARSSAASTSSCSRCTRARSVGSGTDSLLAWTIIVACSSSRCR
jgi:hypothetical protein